MRRRDFLRSLAVALSVAAAPAAAASLPAPGPRGTYRLTIFGDCRRPCEAEAVRQLVANINRDSDLDCVLEGPGLELDGQHAFDAWTLAVYSVRPWFMLDAYSELSDGRFNFRKSTLVNCGAWAVRFGDTVHILMPL